jgi:hypothetical protein
MSPLLRRKQEGGPRLEPGVYEMVCNNVFADHIENSQYGKGDVIKFVLQTVDVIDVDGEYIEMQAMCNDTMDPKGNLSKWLTAFGIAIPDDMDVDLEGVIGRHAMVQVELQDRGEKGIWSKITQIMAMPKRTAQSATRRVVEPAAAPAEPEEPYHPAAKDGEEIVDARLASETQLEALNRLLADVYGGTTKIDAGYQELALELNLPGLKSQLRMPELSRALDALNEKKKALVT